MPDFLYTARQSSGATVTGSLTAATREEALRTLAAQTLMPVRMDAAPALPTRGSKLGRKHLASGFSQLADLLESGVSLVRSVEIVAKQSSQPALTAILNETRDRLADGVSLADALAFHRRAVPEVATSILHAGEEGGFLEESLRQLATYFDRQDDLDSRLRGALAYPAFLTITGTLVAAGMLVFFVPKFAPLFDRLARRGELPALTSLLLTVSQTLRENGVLVGIAFVASAAAGWHQARRPEVRAVLDRIRFRVPALGPLFRDFAVARFCRILGTLLRNGVPILRALRIARDAPGSPEMSKAIERAAEQLSTGRSLAEPLSRAGIFPAEVLEMIAVSEQANRLDQVLVDIASKVETKANRRLELFMRLLEPVLLVVLAGMILLLVVALLLPVMRTAGHLS